MYSSNNLLLLIKKLGNRNHFHFQNKKLPYFFARYNTTYLNERAIEIPISQYYLSQFNGKKILEIGNVLGHYFKINHKVLDKYEKAPGVINEDIIGFKPNGKFDLVISISTFEHIGYDEHFRYSKEEKEKTFDESAIGKAIESSRDILDKDGLLIITVPIGYNSYLDNEIKKGSLPYAERFFFKRINKLNDWMESSFDEVMDLQYGKPYPWANAIMVGIFKSK